MPTDSVNGAIIRSVPFVDRFAVSVSVLCLAHCLLLPILIVALPTLGQSIIASETVHLWLVYAVIPTSLFALGVGCKQHKRFSFMLFGLLGLSFLVLGVAVESIGLDHHWEQPFTVTGALFIAFAHIRNFLECRKSSCKCD